MSSSRISVGVVVALCTACGSPTEPSTSDLPLAAGTYVMLFSTIGATCERNDPTLAVVSSNITLSMTGVDWVAQPLTAADGGFEFRFRRAGPDGPLSIRLAGSVRGTAKGITGTSSRETLVVLGNSNPISGSLFYAGLVSGTVDGAVTFSQGTNVLTCDSAFWFIGPSHPTR